MTLSAIATIGSGAVIGSLLVARIWAAASSALSFFGLAGLVAFAVATVLAALPVFFASAIGIVADAASTAGAGFTFSVFVAVFFLLVLVLQIEVIASTPVDAR